MANINPAISQVAKLVASETQVITLSKFVAQLMTDS